MILHIERLPDAKDLPLPEYKTLEAAGLDLHAAEDKAIGPGQWAAIRTGIKIQLPRFHEGQIRPRSGLALNWGVTVLNAPGTIDEDYTGELMVILINHGPQNFRVRRGDRIAQLVISLRTYCYVTEVEVIERVTERGDKGFGSTGIAA
jgi:dUTP pyrophosphatase